MSKKPAIKKKQDYQATAQIIGHVYDMLEPFEENGSYYSIAAKKLASKIIAEWACSLKSQIKKAKRPKKADIQMVAFLEGYSKFLL